MRRGLSLTVWACTRFQAMLAILILALLTSCSLPPNTPIFASTSRFHAQNVPDGSLRAGEVVHVGTREQVVAGGWAYDVLLAAGIPDSEITDGSVIIVRVFCCGGDNEEATALNVYVTPDEKAGVGDIVEIWSGQMLEQGEPLGPYPNTVTRVLEKGGSAQGACRWSPDNPGLHVRVIFCDWMPSEDWIQQEGLYPVWVNPVAAPTPPTEKT